MSNILVIGISGVTCGGKTTLAMELSKMVPKSRIISQDDYFLDVTDPRHTWVPELNHIHFDILSSLDMDKMLSDVQAAVERRKKPHQQTLNGLAKETYGFQACTNKDDLQRMTLSKLKDSDAEVLIVEGFCIFNYPPIERLCDLKYFFQLDEEECYSRRIKRVYEPPDCPGYFETCVWPEYLNQLEDVRANVKNVVFFDQHTEHPMVAVLSDIMHVLSITPSDT